MLWEPDIVAEIELFPTEAGGRRTPISKEHLPYFGCPLEFNGEMFDVRFDLSELLGDVRPGTSAQLPAKFLVPELIKSRLSVGDGFRLWEGGFIGKGKVLSIHVPFNSSLHTDASRQ